VTQSVSHKAASKKKAPKDTVASRDEAVRKMRAAADKHLGDYSEAERQAWAERTADAYIQRGIIAVRP